MLHPARGCTAENDESHTFCKYLILGDLFSFQDRYPKFHKVSKVSKKSLQKFPKREVKRSPEKEVQVKSLSIR